MNISCNQENFHKTNDLREKFESIKRSSTYSITELDSVDISVEDIKIPPMKESIDKMIDDALIKWNNVEHVNKFADLKKVEKKDHIRATIYHAFKGQWQQNDDDDDDDNEIDYPTSKLQCNQKVIEIFKNLKSYEAFKEECQGNSYLNRYIREHALDNDKTKKGTKRKVKSDQRSEHYIFPVNRIVNTCEKSSILNPEYPTFNKDSVLLHIQLYSKTCKDTKFRELIFHSDQYLSDFKDTIYCSNDLKMEAYKRTSNFFYIEQQFYIDKRSQEMVDLTKCIREWILNDKRHIYQYGMPPEPKSMEKLRFSDIQFQLNKEYLYQHQGNCEHYFQILEIRLPGPTDEQNLTRYPMLMVQTRTVRQKCFVCYVYTAQQICFEDKFGKANPMFYCDQCYYMTHYDDQGNLMYDDFKSYPLYPE